MSKYIDIMTQGDCGRVGAHRVWAVVLTGTIRADDEQDFDYMAIALDARTGEVLATALAHPGQPRPLPSREDRCPGHTQSLAAV